MFVKVYFISAVMLHICTQGVFFSHFFILLNITSFINEISAEINLINSFSGK